MIYYYYYMISIPARLLTFRWICIPPESLPSLYPCQQLLFHTKHFLPNMSVIVEEPHGSDRGNRRRWVLDHGRHTSVPKRQHLKSDSTCCNKRSGLQLIVHLHNAVTLTSTQLVRYSHMR